MSSNTGAYLLPPPVLEDHRDALIIYAEDSPGDKSKARELLEAIENIFFIDGVRGKAALYDETIEFGQSLVSSLDEAVRLSTLVFVIYSDDLENDEIYRHTSNASLWHTIDNKAKSGTFIPVIWKGVSLPAYANEKRPLDMRRDNWRYTLKNVISFHLSKRLDREREQQELLKSRYPQLLTPAIESGLTNGKQFRHMVIPSENRFDPRALLHQKSRDNIDIHGNPQGNTVDCAGNGERTLQAFCNYVRNVINRNVINRRKFCLGAVGFGLISMALITWKAQHYHRSVA